MAPSADLAASISRYGKLPMAFERNRGQAERGVDFVAHGTGYRVSLSRADAVLDLMPRRAAPETAVPTPNNSIRMQFVGAQHPTAGEGLDRLPGKVHYFEGSDRASHRTGIETYARVSYPSVYPGIDVVYYGNQRQLEYDLVVAPGADPSLIGVAFEGVEQLRVDAHGDLVLNAAGETITVQRPLVYQSTATGRRIVDGRYILRNERTVGFQIAEYDRELELVIDPVLSYSTFLGGKSADAATGIAVDVDGNAYITGYTLSRDFPTENQFDRQIGKGGWQAFVSKLDPTGSVLLYSTFLGAPAGRDYATAVAVDSAGSAYVTGTTDGSDFPVTVGAYQTTAVGENAFVAKLAPDGSALVYATYLPGAASTRIAVDATGSAYITGSATSAFTTTATAFQSSIASLDALGTDAFVAKLNPTGAALAYATFLGGSAAEMGTGIAVDGKGQAYVGGWTRSGDFPTENAFQPDLPGSRSGFVAKLDPSGEHLRFSTYLGGASDDSVNAIAIDSRGSVYVAGETYSADFPIRNAVQPVKAGQLLSGATLGSAFVAKLVPSGEALAFSTFLGGETCTAPCSGSSGALREGDVAYAVAADGDGRAHVTGLARSYTFPLLDSLEPRKTDGLHTSLFVSKLGVAGNVLLYSTFARTGKPSLFSSDSLATGVPYGAGNGIALDGDGGAYVVTAVEGGSITTTPGALQTASDGGSDAALFKLLAPSAGIALSSPTNPSSSATPTDLIATISDPTLAGEVAFLDDGVELGRATLSEGSAVLTTTLPPGIRRISAVLRTADGATADSPLLYQVVNPGLVCH